MRRIFLLLYLVSTCFTLFAQQDEALVKLTIEVRDSASLQPLADVMCRVVNSKGKMLSYKIADRKGCLNLTAHQEDVLMFTLIGYGKRKIGVADIRQTEKQPTIILLSPKQVELKEVVVKLSPIRKQGDTLIYNVGSFLQKGDRHLEDVLKKLPGIKVAENGSVSYQGRAINRFYIEGQDLMGNNYTQASRNMPINAVRNVEVLENHQPVKMMQGRKPSESAALNIRLDKNHKVRPFGEITGGLGIKPSVWDNQLFLTQVMKHSQILVSAKMSNTGKDLSKETKEHIDVYNLDAYEPLPQGVLSENISQEALPQERYLQNKSYSAGFNNIITLSKDVTLRSNVLFYKDHAGYNQSTANLYGGLTPTTLETTVWMKQRTFCIVPSLKYEENSTHRFISDELKYSFGRLTNENQVVTNGIGITEQTRIKPSYIKNYLSSSFKLGKSMLQVRSLVRYVNRREELVTASDSLPLYNVTERFATRSTMTRNVITTSIPTLGNDLDISLQAYYRNNSYNYQDDINHRTFKLQGEPGYTWKYKKQGYVTFGLPIEWTRISLSKKENRLSVRNFIAFKPYLTLQQVLTSTLTLNFSSSFSADDNSLDFYTLKPLREGYRNIQVTGNDIYKSTYLHTSFHIRYRNLATMLFANLSLAYSDTRSEAYSHYEYNDSMTIMTWVRGNNHRHNTTISAMMDKTFIPIGLSLKVDATYNRGSYLVSQSGVMVNNHSHNAFGTLTTSFQKLSWMRLSAAFTAKYYWERSSIMKLDVLSSYTTNLSIYLFPTKKMELKMKFYNLTNEITDGHYHTCSLLDGDFNYKINNVWELRLSGTNLLNSKSYSITQNVGINTFNTFLPLRGREILLSLQLRF